MLLCACPPPVFWLVAVVALLVAVVSLFVAVIALFVAVVPPVDVYSTISPLVVE